MPLHGPYAVDWIYSTTATAHVANHRDWFSKYTKFRSIAKTPCGHPLQVYGIGDVELEVRSHASSTEHGPCNGYRTLILRDVLYAPSSDTNIVADKCLKPIFVSFAGWEAFFRSEVYQFMLLDQVGPLYKLWLAGHPRGQTLLDLDKDYDLGVDWPQAERQRWEASKRGTSVDKLKSNPTNSDFSPPQPPGSPILKNVHFIPTTGLKREAEGLQQNGQPIPPVKEPAAPAMPSFGYSEAEKTWLKKSFGNEWKFLRQYGLKIHGLSDRQQGRRLVQSFMEEDRATERRKLEEGKESLGGCVFSANGHAWHGTRWLRT